MKNENSAKLGSITVTYHPVPEIVARQLASLPANCLKLLVDNGSTSSEKGELLHAIRGLEKVHMLELDANLGIAAALNRGIDYLASLGGADWVLLLDQDSEPEEGSVGRLLEAAIERLDGGRVPGAVGPALRDPITGKLHGFHLLDGWHYRRIAAEYDHSHVECVGINGSGTLAQLETFRGVGALREDLFIDHVDTEWCFRLRAQGGRFYGIPNAVFRHRMGESSRRLWLLGWRVWPERSPLRLRYLGRNTVSLIGMHHVPAAWKVWAVGKLVLTGGLVLLTGPRRVASLAALLRGAVDGVCGRGGAIREPKA